MDYRSGGRGHRPHTVDARALEYQPEEASLAELADRLLLALIVVLAVVAVVLFACAAFALWFGAWPL